MPTCQLNVRVERALAAKLRSEAKRRRQTPGALVAEAIEGLLAGASPAPAQPLAADSKGLAAALAALAERVERLERLERPRPLKPKTPIEAPAGAITTAELADRSGTNRGAWNTWASKAAPGQVRHHPQAGSWRLVGKAPAPEGGPPRWLWEVAG